MLARKPVDSRRGADIEQNHAWEIVAMTYPKPTVRTVSGNGTFVIGRGSTANVRLGDASVSREHARLTFGGPSVEVEDLNSANGTRLVRVVEGKEHAETHDAQLRPHTPTVVPENATLQVGNVVVLVRRSWRSSAALPMGLVAASESMKEVLRLLGTVASSQLHVVLVGPPGVGRDTLARALHDRSARAQGPFVATQASARMAAVMERELFGIERDELRGAAQPKAGLLEAAHGGTLLIDSAAALAPALKTELLRALSGGQVTRVGARKATPIDVRLVVGTTSDDAFCRSVCQLGGVILAIPALRERYEDILPMAEAFVARAAHALGREAPPISERAREILLKYDFPQDTRELGEIMTRAVPLAGTGAILPEHLLIFSEDGTRELADESDVTQLRQVPKLTLPPQ